MNRKKLYFIIGSVLGAALIAWIVLIVSILNHHEKSPKKESPKDPSPSLTVSEGPAEPTSGEQEPDDGLILVFRQTGHYRVFENGDRQLIEQSRYNSNGNMLENTYYDDGVLSYRSVYEYDEAGRMTRAYDYASDGTLNYKAEYYYDEKGRRCRTYNENIYGKYYESVITYDDEDRVIRIENNENYGYYADSETFEYDADGNEILHITDCTSSDGDIFRQEHKYDNQNRLSEFIESRNGEEYYRETYQYDADSYTCTTYRDGRPTDQAVYNYEDLVLKRFDYIDGRLLLRTENSYYSGENKLREINYGDNGEIILDLQYDYDEDGLLIRVRRGSYDEDGNTWIEMVTMECDYDESGRKLRKPTQYRYYSFYTQQLYSIQTYEYDEEGRILLIESWDGKDMRKLGADRYTYDVYGNRLTFENWNSDGKETYRYAYEYQEFHLPPEKLTEEERAALGLE